MTKFCITSTLCPEAPSETTDMKFLWCRHIGRTTLSFKFHKNLTNSFFSRECQKVLLIGYSKDYACVAPIDFLA